MGDTDREWAIRQHPGLVDSNQIIDLEPEADLEFKVYTFDFSGPQSPSGVSSIEERNKQIETLLTDGWQLDDKIVCPPSVTLIFSREKEEKETTE